VQEVQVAVGEWAALEGADVGVRIDHLARGVAPEAGSE
jgi:hypothetical protein